MMYETTATILTVSVNVIVIIKFSSVATSHARVAGGSGGGYGEAEYVSRRRRLLLRSGTQAFIVHMALSVSLRYGEDPGIPGLR